MWSPLQTRLNAFEDKLAAIEAEAASARAGLVALQQGAWDFASFGSSGFGMGSIFNNNGVGSGGAPASLDCLTFNVKGQGCGSPVNLAGAALTVTDVFGNTVGFATTDAAGNANLCLIDGVEYTVTASATGHTTMAFTEEWPFPSVDRSFLLGYPYGTLCWGGCANPIRADLLLTSKFGAFRLTPRTSGGPLGVQTGTANLFDPTCTMGIFNGHYPIVWSVSTSPSTNPLFGGLLTANLYIVNCGVAGGPYTNGNYHPWDQITPPRPSPQAFFGVRPTSVTCGPPFSATFDFSSFPPVFGNVGSYTVTLQG